MRGVEYPQHQDLSPGVGDEDPFGVSWALAADFDERLLSLRRAAPASHPVDADLARRRLERWRGRPAFAGDDDLWRRRLAGVRDDELETLLGEPPEEIAARLGGEPPWLAEVRAAYDVPVAEPFPWPETAALACQRSPFLAFAEPLVRRFHGRLTAAAREVVRGRPEAPFVPETAADALLGHVPELVASLVGRVMVVELHAARLEGRLEGTTPEERFGDFVAGLRRRDVALELLAAYPVLARHLVLCLEQWCEAGLEFLGHLADDAPELRRRFAGGGDLGLLVEATGAVSDPHRGGRGVYLLRFDDDLRLVYKPRSLAVEAAFQGLLTWIGERGFEPAFRALEVFDAGDHGWVEHVSPATCADEAALGRFFERQGATAALLHLLDGTDVHHENLIAAGEHPVLVDLETLFHPWIQSKSLRGVASLPGAQLRESPLRSGLLPQRVWGDRENAGVDISALGATEGQLTPKAVLAPSARGTDEMRFERKRLEIELGDSRPRLEGQRVALLDHAASLEVGFRRFFLFATEHKEALTAADGPLVAFAGAETRVLFRPTAVYGTLLFEATHPHLQSNALERHFLFDALWAGVRSRPFLAEVVESELADLRRGDVPSFYARPDRRDLWTSRGERLADFFETSPLDDVRRRIEELGPARLERHLQVLRTSLEVVRLGAGQNRGRPSYPFRERSRPAPRQELLAAAEKVGRRLVDIAFDSPGGAFWLTVEHAEPEGWRIGVTGPDLYLGLPGIALFLAHLGALTGDDVTTDIARRAIRTQEHQLAEDATQVVGIGAWNGWGSLVYSLHHLGVLWGDGALLDRAEELLADLPPKVETDEVFDLVAGSAGLLTVLLGLARDRPSAALWRLARACGDRLVEKAMVQEKGGLGWPLALVEGRALAGLSHGAAGIALALLRYAAATGEEHYRRTALAGMDYERALFDAARGNWPDLRVDAAVLEGGAQRFMTGWCHGAPGIGLARLSGLPVHDDAAVRAEIEAAVETTLATGFGSNHCLCHGDLGNLDFLLEAALTLGDDALRAKVDRLAGGVLDAVSERGWLYGLQDSVETPGLMVGLASIGYGFLRLADPERVPSLLALDPPGATRDSRRGAPPPAEDVSEPEGVGGFRGDAKGSNLEPKE